MSKLVLAGTCLGVGFWISKKLTNKIDEVMISYDKRALNKLASNLEA